VAATLIPPVVDEPEKTPPAGTRKATRPPRRPLELDTAAVVAIGLLTLTLLVVGFGLFLFAGSGISAHRDQSLMYRQLKSELAQATVPVNGAIPVGTPIGLVEMPDIGLRQVFVEGSASAQTATGPGLRRDTVLPGQAGASVLVGRRATYGRAFAHLDQVKVGDIIKVTTGQGVFTYDVDLVRTSDAADVLIAQVASRLTLVTSDPAITPSRTLMVSAQLQGDALPATTRQATYAEDVPGQGSLAGHQVGLLLNAQLLLLLSVVVTRSVLRRTTARGVLWIGATPVALALLWSVFSDLAALLPNTL
jgi:sortase A